MRDWKTELSKTCEELNKLKKKYGTKRCGIKGLFNYLIKKRFNKQIRLRYSKGKKPPLITYLDLIQNRAFLFGYSQAIKDVKELR